MSIDNAIPNNEDNIKEESPLCPECGKRKLAMYYRRKDGSRGFRKKCDRCRGKPTISGAEGARRRSKIDKGLRGSLKCSNTECTSTIVDLCQLDVDHIDGDKRNNDPSNLQVLCANCHRLKTKLNDYFTSLKYR